jgi:hypothetical protein
MPLQKIKRMSNLLPALITLPTPYMQIVIIC